MHARAEECVAESRVGERIHIAPVVARTGPGRPAGRGIEGSTGVIEELPRGVTAFLEEDDTPGEKGSRIVPPGDLPELEPRPHGGHDPVVEHRGPIHDPPELVPGIGGDLLPDAVLARARAGEPGPQPEGARKRPRPANAGDSLLRHLSQEGVAHVVRMLEPVHGDLEMLPTERGDGKVLEPDGAVPASGPPPSASLSEEVQTRHWTLAQAMRTVSFWAVAVAFVLVLLAQTGYLIHEIAFLEDRTGSRTAASVALSLGAIGSIVARLIVGAFADSLSKRHLSAGLFAFQAVSVLLITFIETDVTNYVFAFTFGCTIGNIYMMQSLLTSEIFGYVSFGAVFGMISFTSQVSSGAGPLLVGLLEQATGGYESSFLVTACITLAAAVVVLFARPVRLPEADSAP